MRILMLTQLFQPEPNHLKGLAFAKALQAGGHDVEVLTGFPNYPTGKLYPGYRLRWKQREVMDGIPVVRIPHYLSHSNSTIPRILSYTSFAASASFWGPLVLRRPDVVHVYQGPITLAAPAMAIRRLHGVPFVLDVQDIWPESLTASGMLNGRTGLALLQLFCDLAYRKAARIVVLSPGYKAAIADRGIPETKIDVVYNWCDEKQLTTAHQKGPDPFGLGGRFNVVFAGNMGKVQALDCVIEAAAILQQTRTELQFLFVGAGVDSGRLIQLTKDKGLANVRFIPRLPPERMDRIYAFADVLLLHLKDDPLCRMSIPQKTQAYLAAGKPLLIGAPGETAALVERAGAGIFFHPEDSASLAEAIVRLMDLSPAQRRAMGDRGRAFYETELSFQVGVRRMIRIFEETANARHV